MKKISHLITEACLNSNFLVRPYCIFLVSIIPLSVSAQVACVGLNCSGGNQAVFQGVQIGPCTGKFCVCATGGLHLWDFGDGGNSGSDACVRRQITNDPNAATTFAGFAQNPLLIQGGMSENPTHIFSTTGTFTVNHWFVQGGGIQHATFNIAINGNVTFPADFTYEIKELTCSSAIYNFSSDPDLKDVDCITHTWTFENGTPATSSLPNPLGITYTQEGCFDVTHTVTGACGSSTEIVEICIDLPGEPVFANFSITGSFCGTLPRLLSFQSASNPAGTTHYWDFGNGQTSTLANPANISFTQSGSYTIFHSVEDASGCYKDEVTQTINIFHLPPPIANFTFAGQAVCDNGLIVFADASQYAETWLWDFGDGTSSNLQNPTHAYSTAGTYTVTLTITNGCGNDVETQFLVTSSTVFDYTVPSSMTLQQAINLQYLPNQTTIQSKNIFINGQLTITNATPFWELATCNITMAPGAGITVGSGSTFKIERSNFASCDTMWRGIWMESSTASSTLEMISVYISDAEYAVWPDLRSIVNISTSQFDKNFIGLFYNAANGFVLGPFYSNRFTASAHLLPPYSGQMTQPGSKPFAGIDTRNQQLLNIGVTGAFITNLFQNQSNCILTDGANLTVVNTRFENILATSEYAAPTGFGISCRAANNRQLYQDGVLSNNTAGLPTFKNCTQAILVQKMRTTVFNNLMENVVHGIRVEGVSGQDIVLEVNDIHCRETGIELIENDAATRVWVSQNTIEVGELVSGTVSGAGIFVSENGVAQTDAQILNNTIGLHQVNGGISLVKTNGYTVEVNMVNLHSPNLNLFGLNANGGDANTFSCNDVVGSGSGIGLSTLSSANTTWSCNDIENTSTGAIFYGPCIGTEMLTTDFTPPFNTGLYYTPSVMMDPQVHRGNRWNGGIYAQGAARWDGVTFQQVGQSIFKIHTQSPPFYPPSFNLPLGINPNDWFVPDPIGSPDICNEETSCTPSGITGGEGETRKKVASGEYTNPLYDGAITWQAEQQVFAVLDANPAFQNEYPEVGQFYQDNQQSTIGKLHNIEKSTTQLYRSLPETREAIRLLNAAISENIADLLEIDADLVGTEGSAYQDLMVQREAKLEEATALGQELDNLAAQVLSAQTIQANALIVENASITTNAVYQANEKTVNDIYLTTLAKGDLTFTPTQTATLKAIAEQCPLSGGIGVYKARSLYALNARVYYDDEQLCAVGMQLQQPINQTLPAKSDNAFKVYPNPNTGAFTLEYPVGTTALVMLQDLTGHLIYRQVLAQDDRRKEFSVGQFQPGIYFLKIMTEGRIVHAERIIIIR